MVVKTNIDHQVTAAFVTESETTEAISEALVIIREWNPDVYPKYMMTAATCYLVPGSGTWKTYLKKEAVTTTCLAVPLMSTLSTISKIR